MARRKRQPAEEPFQMAPMIDMVFLLLVFFMTVSTMAKDARPEIELPVSTTAAVPEAAPPRDIVSVKPGDSGFIYHWGNRVVTLEKLGELMQKGRDDGTELLLRGEPELPWKAWEELLNRCREAGISDLVFATFED